MATGVSKLWFGANSQEKFSGLIPQSNANFIELILLNKSFKIPTVEQLEGKGWTGIFGHLHGQQG